MKNWAPAKKRQCKVCGAWYWNAGYHAETCTGEPASPVAFEWRDTQPIEDDE